MSAYKLLPFGIQRTSDGAVIPPDPANRDWRDYQAWLGLGNTPDPADPAPTPLTPQQVAQALINGTDPISVTLRGLIIVLANKFSITPQAAITAIVNAAT